MPWITTNTGVSPGRARLRGLVRTLLDGGVAWVVVVAAMVLSGLGVIAIDHGAGFGAVAGSAAGAGAGPGQVGGVGGGASTAAGLHPIAMKQLALVSIAVLAGALAAIPNYRILGRASWVLMALAAAMLLFLLIPWVPRWLVTPRNGARGWINLGPVDFQPAEAAKIAYVLVLAWYMRYSTMHRTLRGLIPPALITAVPVGLIMLQPDLGTAILFIPVLFAVLVAAGARLKHLAIIVVVASLAAPAAFPILKPHQQARILGLIQQVRGDRSADQDINMQSVTAQRLIGAGGAAGIPREKSKALVQFSRLPERHNDMILAVIANRWGLWGVAGLLAAYGVWIGGALLTAASIREPFARLVIVGCCGFIVAQVFVNVGMNLGILPIIGITLPFVSYGGSSMATAWAMTGLIIGIAVRRPAMPMRRSFEYSDAEEG